MVYILYLMSGSKDIKHNNMGDRFKEFGQLQEAQNSKEKLEIPF